MSGLIDLVLDQSINPIHIVPKPWLISNYLPGGMRAMYAPGFFPYPLNYDSGATDTPVGLGDMQVTADVEDLAPTQLKRKERKERVKLSDVEGITL